MCGAFNKRQSGKHTRSPSSSKISINFGGPSAADRHAAQERRAAELKRTLEKTVDAQGLQIYRNPKSTRAVSLTIEERVGGPVKPWIFEAEGIKMGKQMLTDLEKILQGGIPKERIARFKENNGLAIPSESGVLRYFLLPAPKFAQNIAKQTVLMIIETKEGRFSLGEIPFGQFNGFFKGGFNASGL